MVQPENFKFLKKLFVNQREILVVSDGDRILLIDTTSGTSPARNRMKAFVYKCIRDKVRNRVSSRMRKLRSNVDSANEQSEKKGTLEISKRKVVQKKDTVSNKKAKKSTPQQEGNIAVDIEDVPMSLKGKLKRNLSQTREAAESSERWEPLNWKLQLDSIREMRKNNDAPVDSMGCDKCMDESGAPEVLRFQALVSLMLSSQTKDEITFAAMARLRNNGSGLTIDNVLTMSDETLGNLIKPVGFWKTKVQNIKKVATILKNEYNGDIPNTVELLCKLPGVGPKMANLCMVSAWGILSGIGVDTHVHRISNRLGWVKKPTKTPEATRVELESWLPKDLWKEVNHLLVGFGQQTCKAIHPLCESCCNLPYCSFGQKEVKGQEKRTKKQRS